MQGSMACRRSAQLPPRIEGGLEGMKDAVPDRPLASWALTSSQAGDDR